MFEDISSNLSQTKDSFDSMVRDPFGASIDDTVFEPADQELRKMEEANHEAEMAINGIRLLTLELRTIL
ncbi:MAG: hypothetical protein LUH14_10715 [Clostridiaceae bacterium]|nr:hypothetical protein [Clostridiaceae bacterium]